MQIFSNERWTMLSSWNSSSLCTLCNKLPDIRYNSIMCIDCKCCALFFSVFCVIVNMCLAHNIIRNCKIDTNPFEKRQLINSDSAVEIESECKVQMWSTKGEKFDINNRSSLGLVMIFICIDSACKSFHKIASVFVFYSRLLSLTCHSIWWAILFRVFNVYQTIHFRRQRTINGMSLVSFLFLFIRWFLSSELIHLAFDWRTCHWNIRFQLKIRDSS